ncbi:MAG: histidine phosphatase family protein [Sulfitobacter sp.]|nr:histidine phosphatase family protein [Sulfitobacter sp.]
MTRWPLPATSFCLIRHGETTANADNIIAGITDVPLSAHGRNQAQTLSIQAWPDQIALFSSPLSRAQDTCTLAFPNHEYALHDGLRERDWGVFEGCPLAQQPNRDDTPQGGESWPAMLGRVHGTISEICALPHGALPVLVCHSGIIRAARVLWTTGTVGDRPPNARPILFERSDHIIEEKQL